MDTKEKYIQLFDNILDSFQNSTFVLVGKGLTEKERLDILEHIAFRCQIEFEKEVRFISSYDVKESEILLPKKYDSSYLPVQFKPENTIFLTNINISYYDTLNNWELDMLTQLAYYKYPVFGFSSHQVIKVYE